MSRVPGVLDLRPVGGGGGVAIGVELRQRAEPETLSVSRVPSSWICAPLVAVRVSPDLVAPGQRAGARHCRYYPCRCR